MEHYVYVYRDHDRRPLYVGYGRSPSRATEHLDASHNPDLASFLNQRSKFTLEVAGPFLTEEMGRQAETLLISALRPDFNRDPGPERWRLRPLGLPLAFVERFAEEPLGRGGLFEVQGATPMPVLAVRITDQDFGDGRVGYDPVNPPADDQVLVRADRWWQLESFLPTWSANPDRSPGLLLAIYGKPGAQLIIASLHIDQKAWGAVERFPSGQGKIQVPVLGPTDLDALGLRGRRLTRAAGIVFDRYAAAFFVILHPDGSTSGGRRDRRPLTPTPS